MHIAIIGAGLAGLACATRLAASGHTPSLFDKGRGPGGRMATRRMATAAGEAAFDHGAQYFTARESGFQAEVAGWEAAGAAARWPAAGPEAWVGVPAMNAPAKHLAAALDVAWNTRVDSIARRPDGWHVAGADLAAGPFDTVLVATPAEQAAPLLAPFQAAWAALAEANPALPCWTVMAAFDAPVSAPDVLQEDGPIGWAARNTAKPGRAGPEAWVIQAGPAWSAAQLELPPEAILPLLMDAFAARTGAPLPPVLAAAAHRWRYAKSGRAGLGALWDGDRGLGACGDWLLGPRVECAWVSGVLLAEMVKAA